jgi:hypothetical protein
MFDEIPGPTKRPSRTQAWFWIGLSLLWLVIGSSKIAKHKDFGWPIVVLWAFSLLIWGWRLVASYREKPKKETSWRSEERLGETGKGTSSTRAD